MVPIDTAALAARGIFAPLDIHFAQFISRVAQTDDPDLWLAAAMVSSHTRQGHVCLDLAALAGKTTVWQGKGEETPMAWPELEGWRRKLTESAVVGEPGEFKPLILDGAGRLFLFRYWDYQDRLARLISQRLRPSDSGVDILRVRDGLKRLFPENPGGETDWQKVAAFTALTRKFCIISGGPGTGKTTIITKIMALLLEQHPAMPLRIALAAPTGKAAARLQASVARTKINLDCGPSIKNLIPETASTLHRLLGAVPGSPYFRYNEKNKLSVDLVVVDEASMVDLALMSKLVQALPVSAQLILLGDKDQLASVEAGAVLGDFCTPENTGRFSKQFCREYREIAANEMAVEQYGDGGICDAIVQLEKNYRFGQDSGIGQVSRAVNQGRPDLSMGMLRAGKYEDISFKDAPPAQDLTRQMAASIVRGYRSYLGAADPLEAFKQFETFRILCAFRHGPYGVVAVNRLAEKILQAEKLLSLAGKWYPGRPILIQRNDYHLQLFNGDVGIIWPDPGDKDDLRAFFPSADGGFRKIHPMRLPEHETVFAMTVHKAQGSEFDHMLFLLPDTDSPLLTRELIYTAMTRARKKAEIWGTEDIFQNAVSRRSERTGSGLVI
ncbi:MAG: exodeoxyribonuclease V subunit alpha [Desulfobacterales bacterium]|nr:exodeoxyribonuclease V subunit alpha [Desulfobacterales bacterium]